MRVSQVDALFFLRGALYFFAGRPFFLRGGLVFVCREWRI